jgi:hypothetical protein
MAATSTTGQERKGNGSYSVSTSVLSGNVVVVVI